MKSKKFFKTVSSTATLLAAIGFSNAASADDWKHSNSTEEDGVHEMRSNTSPIHTGKRSQEYEDQEETYSKTYESDDHMRKTMTNQPHLHPSSETENDSNQYNNDYSKRNVNDSERFTGEFDDSGKMKQSLFFEFDSTELTRESEKKLSKMVDSLDQRSMNDLEIEVVGYTDNSGPEVYNKHLSVERAKAIQSKITSEINEVEVKDWTVEGKGESNPLANNDSRQGRMENRRVEIVVSRGAKEQLSQSSF